MYGGKPGEFSVVKIFIWKPESCSQTYGNF